MRAAIYCRVSSAGQRENYSLGSQEDLCRRYAASQHWTVVHVESEQHSGADLHDREGLQRALTLIEDGGADVLLALATDRLSREQLHIGVILDRVLRVGRRCNSSRRTSRTAKSASSSSRRAHSPLRCT